MIVIIIIVVLFFRRSISVSKTKKKLIRMVLKIKPVRDDGVREERRLGRSLTQTMCKKMRKKL